MYKTESVLENVTHVNLCDFKRQTEHQILARTLDPVLINKEKKNW